MPAENPSITVKFEESKEQLFDCVRTQLREEETRRWRAESVRHELAEYHVRMARLLSQHEPVDRLGIDREKLRVVLNYVQHGDAARMDRVIAEMEENP